MGIAALRALGMQLLPLVKSPVMLRYALLSLLLAPLDSQEPAHKRDPLAAIDAIAAPTTTAEARGEAFDAARAASFPSIAVKLVRTLEACRVRRGVLWPESGMGPRTDKPWLEQDLRPEDRISFTLHRLWDEHTRPGIACRDAALCVEILEDRQADEMRTMAVPLLASRLGEFLREDPEFVRHLMQRLDKLARTDTSHTIRASIVSMLAAHVEPDPLLDLALEIARTEKAPLQQGELLRRTEILAAMPRMTPAVRGRCLKEAFALLRRVDDGKGAGYFLALDIGRGLGIEPVSPGAGPFSPDPRSPAHQHPHGLAPSYFQDTVKNALAWYDKHKDG